MISDNVRVLRALEPQLRRDAAGQRRGDAHGLDVGITTSARGIR